MEPRDNKNTPFVICVTGGIGAGKSAVCNIIFDKYNIPVYNSDTMAKTLMQNDSTLKTELIKSFGKKTYENGILNTVYLADTVFKNKNQLNLINSIVHPVVQTHFLNWLKKHHNEKLVFFESALITHNKPDYIDKICYVNAKESIRIERTQKRDSLSVEEIKNRINSQQSEINLNNDYLINNNSNNLETLNNSVKGLLELINDDFLKIKKASKYISLLLRHKPEKENLTIDKFGWVKCKELCAALDIDKYDLKYIVKSNNKQRFSFNDNLDLIRANQGHSINVNLNLTQEVPPKVLYHGTSSKLLNDIYAKGLLKMSRNHVHLTEDLQTAKAVGFRKDKIPVILIIDAQKMHKEGIKFYKSKNGVWLTEYVDSNYIDNC